MRFEFWFMLFATMMAWALTHSFLRFIRTGWASTSTSLRVTNVLAFVWMLSVCGLFGYLLGTTTR